MNRRLVQLTLVLTFFLFGMILTSVGSVIQLLITTFSVSKTDAYVLEPLKDIPIVLFAFLMGAYLVKFGLKKALVVGLSLVSLAAVLLATFKTFWAAKVFFAFTGFSFGLAKISGYSIIAFVQANTRKHMSLMNFMEAVFMLGVLASYSIFNYINVLAEESKAQWPLVFWLFGALSIIILIIVWFIELDESSLTSHGIKKIESQDFFSTLNLIANPMVGYFMAAIFTFVMLEQGIGAWLPTFNNEILRLSEAFSLDFITIIAWAAVLGRLMASVLVRVIDWFILLRILLFSSALLMLLTFPLTQNLEQITVNGWSDAPLATYIFPVIYLLLAPMYPIISSVILTSLPRQVHSAMTGIIITFSALGSSIGALITAIVYLQVGSEIAFYLYLIPLSLLVFFMWKMYQKMEKKDPLLSAE